MLSLQLLSYRIVQAAFVVQQQNADLRSLSIDLGTETVRCSETIQPSVSTLMITTKNLLKEEHALSYS